MHDEVLKPRRELETGEMSQWSRELVTVTEDPHVVAHTVYNSSSRLSDASSWPL